MPEYPPVTFGKSAILKKDGKLTAQGEAAGGYGANYAVRGGYFIVWYGYSQTHTNYKNIPMIPLDDLTFVALGIDFGRAEDIVHPKTGAVLRPADMTLNKGYLGLGIWKASANQYKELQDLTLIKPLLESSQARTPISGECCIYGRVSAYLDDFWYSNQGIPYSEFAAIVNLGKFWFIDMVRWHDELNELRRYVGFFDVEDWTFIDCQHDRNILGLADDGASLGNPDASATYSCIFKFS